jgi:hypothetical protein
LVNQQFEISAPLNLFVDRALTPLLASKQALKQVAFVENAGNLVVLDDRVHFKERDLGFVKASHEGDRCFFKSFLQNFVLVSATFKFEPKHRLLRAGKASLSEDLVITLLGLLLLID